MADEIGTYGKSRQSCMDPYSGPVQNDDLVHGYGTPKGFEMRTFSVAVDDARDSRLTEKGIRHLARQLRREAFDWMVKEVKDRGEPNWLCCTTPQVTITTSPTPAYDPLGKPKLYIGVKVYIYPRLQPTIQSHREEAP